MASPLVSVLLPVRNGADTIARAVDSILNQTLSELELIIVNDGSNDHTPQILNQFTKKDSRVKVIHQAPKGIVAALQAASQVAKATFLARMDADDYSYPQRFEKQLEMLESDPKIGAVGCLVQSSSSIAENQGWKRYEKWLNSCLTTEDIHRNIFIESPLAHPSVVMRRSAFQSLGGYRYFDGPEDYDLWLRFYNKGWALSKVPEVLFEWHDHPKRLTRTHASYRTDAFIMLKAYHLASGPLVKREPDDRPVWIWGAGRYGRLLGRALENQGVPIEAYIDVDSSKIGRKIRGVNIVSEKDLRSVAEMDFIPFILTAVPIDRARLLIIQYLISLGLKEQKDYWCCA